MDSDVDSLIVASTALWAGDVERFEAAIKPWAKQISSSVLRESAESAEQVIAAAAVFRLHQLHQKRGEFRKHRPEPESRKEKLGETGLPISTEHLAGVVWRSAAREFSLQAFLTDLSFETALFENASRIARPPERATRRNTPGQQELFKDKKAVAPLGYSWVVLGNPFIQAELTDMGLIEATAIWTSKELPKGADAVVGPFRKLLDSLDGPRREHTHFVNDR